MKTENMCKRLAKILLVMSAVVTLTACGNSEKSGKEIIEDLNNSELVAEYYLDEYAYTVTDFEITKRNTKEKETDNVFATFVMVNDWKEVHGEIELLYNFYSTGGWLLDELNLSWDSLYYVPLKGCDSWRISEDLYEYGIDSEFLISDDVDLETGIETLVLDATMEGELLSRMGTVTAEYLFSPNSGEWTLADVYGNDDFYYAWNGWGTYASPNFISQAYADIAYLLYFYEGDSGEVCCQRFSYAALTNTWKYAHDYTWKDKEINIDLNSSTISIGATNYLFDLDSFYYYSGDEGFVKISNGRASAKEWANLIGVSYNDQESTTEGEQGDPLLFDENTILYIFGY